MTCDACSFDSFDSDAYFKWSLKVPLAERSIICLANGKGGILSFQWGFGYFPLSGAIKATLLSPLWKEKGQRTLNSFSGSCWEARSMLLAWCHSSPLLGGRSSSRTLLGAGTLDRRTREGRLMLSREPGVPRGEAGGTQKTRPG